MRNMYFYENKYGPYKLIGSVGSFSLTYFSYRIMEKWQSRAVKTPPEYLLMVTIRGRQVFRVNLTNLSDTTESCQYYSDKLPRIRQAYAEELAVLKNKRDK